MPSTERGFERWVSSNWPEPRRREKPGGAFRILGLSDSFGVVGGADNYHYALERMLRAGGRPVEVVNFSVAQYEPHDELKLLRRFGGRYKPDLILHGFTVGNDLDAPADELLYYKGIGLRSRGRRTRSRFWRSLLVRWLRRKATARADRLRVRRETPDADPEAGILSQQRFLRIMRRRAELCRREPALPEPWRRTAEILDELRLEAGRMGARYAMVVHPDQYQVEESLWKTLKRAHGLSESDFDLGKPQEFLRGYCASRSIACLDLLPVFRSAGADGGLYLLRDTHYNGAGNKLAAARIRRFLIESGLLRRD